MNEKWLGESPKQAQGNGAVLLLVDSSDAQSYQVVKPAILSALGHLGIPYATWDLKAGPVNSADISRYACLILGQDHLGKKLGESGAQVIRDAVKDGMGLVSFDGDLGSFSGAFYEIFNISVGKKPLLCSQIKTVGLDHYITGTRELDDEAPLDNPVEFWPIESPQYGLSRICPLQTENNRPAIAISRYAKGKAVLFTASVKLWIKKHLGHACGLDDVFWKSIVWAARKPFVIYAMPPFATALIDDCSGSYNHFGFVDTMNRYGWLPHLEVYMEDIDRVMHEEDYADSKKMKWLYENALAEFGVHGFTYDKLMWFDHAGRKPLNDEQLSENFRRYDGYLAKWGIRPSRVENCHFSELGRNALPYLKERGITYISMSLPLDTGWFDVPEKKPALEIPGPYNHRGYNMADVPDDPHFFTIRSRLDAKDRTSTTFHSYGDFLWDNTMFWDEAPKTNVEAAIKVAVLQARRGVDSRFFGQIMTHEQRVATVNRAEWEEIFAGIREGLKKYDLIFRRTEFICDYARSHYNSHIATINVNRESGQIGCDMEGEARVTTALEVYEDEGESVKGRLVDVPPFTGLVNVKCQAD